jgi:DNA repair protein RadC
LGDGHRERLRQRFLAEPESVSDAQLLELFLTYAVPRRDVRLLAEGLITRYGSLAAVLDQKAEELASFSGLGGASACLLRAVAAARQAVAVVPTSATPKPRQAILPGLLSEKKLDEGRPPKKTSRRGRPATPIVRPTSTPGLRAYTNDLVNFAVDFLPKADRFPDLLSYRDYLFEHLTVNAQTTRERYSQYLINRFFPNDRYARDLVAFACALRDTQALRDVVFYLTAAAEPIVAKIAVEVISPALPRGALSRLQLLHGIEARLHVAPSAVRDTMQAVVRTYARLGVAEATPKELRLRLREGSLDALVFVLHREFPSPGMYDLRRCLEGPAHTWLLWSQDWIRKALYRLRELGILAKVSEIDRVRQFTTRYTGDEAMATWLRLPEERRR